MSRLRFQLTLFSVMLMASHGLAEIYFYRGKCTTTLWDIDHFRSSKNGAYYVIDTNVQKAAEIRSEPDCFRIEIFEGVKTTVMPNVFNLKFVVFSMSTLKERAFVGDTLDGFHFRGRVNKAVDPNVPSVITGRRDYVAENSSHPQQNPTGFYLFTEYNMKLLGSNFFKFTSTNRDAFRNAVERMYDFVSAHRGGEGASLPWERGTPP